MRLRVGVVGVAAVTALAVAGCDHREGASLRDEPRRCDPRLVTPDGFEATGSVEDRTRDHTGVRIDLRAADGRELHYFSGFPGEFGEGLPDRGRIALASGAGGRLAGQGTTWVVQWESAPPCTPTVVLGTRMSRRAFLDALRSAGALPGR